RLVLRRGCVGSTLTTPSRSCGTECGAAKSVHQQESWMVVLRLCLRISLIPYDTPSTSDGCFLAWSDSRLARARAAVQRGVVHQDGRVASRFDQRGRDGHPRAREAP